MMLQLLFKERSGGCPPSLPVTVLPSHRTCIWSTWLPPLSCCLQELAALLLLLSKHQGNQNYEEARHDGCSIRTSCSEPKAEEKRHGCIRTAYCSPQLPNEQAKEKKRISS